MGKVYEGSLVAKGLRFAIVVSRFNDFVGHRLKEGALDTLVRSGASREDIDVVMVPGSFEIPLVARTLARTRKYDAVVCVGVIVRGETPHFDYVCAEVSKGIARVSLEEGVPVAFGIVTADTLEQAMERAGAKAGNKGRDAALSAIEMANLLRGLREG